MITFEDRKKAYLSKLKETPKIGLFKITELLKIEKIPRCSAVVLNPQTEKELETACAYLSYIQDCSDLGYRIPFGEIQEIDPKNSMYVNYISDLITAINNKESTEKIISKYLGKNREHKAKLSYERTVLLCQDLTALTETINANTNIKFTNFTDISNFIKPATDTIEKMTFESDEGMDEMIEFSKKFHALCIQGKKQRHSDFKFTNIKLAKIR